MRPAEMSFVTLMGSEDDRFEQVALDPPTVHPALCSLTDPWECAASLVGDRRQAEGATSCIDRAEGTRPELCPGAPVCPVLQGHGARLKWCARRS